MLTIPSSCAVDPLLYTARDGSTTGFHQDLAVTGDLSRNDAALVLQEWTASLNLTGQVLHNIKFRDFEAAESYNQLYFLSGENLKDLIVQLDMTDTDVATFQDDNRANIVSLGHLLSQIKEYDELQDAEVTFRNQKKILGLKSIELLGEDLRVELKSNYNGYAARSGRVINISRKFGLDTSEFEQSVTDFAAIVADIDSEQDMRSSSIQEMIRELQSSGKDSGTLEAASTVNMTILPDHGAFGDTLLMTGTAPSPAGTVVTILVDGRRLESNVTVHDGRFSFPFKIEQIEARAHTAYASVGSDISDVSTFTVASRNTTLSLTVRPAEENGTKKCIGTGRLVTQDGVPVPGAPVYVDVDGQTSWEHGMTGTDGVFTLTSEPLSLGTHTLKAQFDPDGFPLNGSESAPVTVVVSAHLGWLASVVYLLGIGGSAIGGVLFLRKRHASDAPPSDPTVEEAPGRVAGPPLTPTIEEAHLIANQIPVVIEGQVDAHKTIAQTYRQVVQELEARNPALQLKSRTPRNLVALFADRPFGPQLAVLVGIHEKIWYAEYEPTDENLDQMREAFIQILTEGSGH